MAEWSWAYVDCTGDGNGQAAGPTGSLQYLTGTNATSGSTSLLYYTASIGDLAASTMVLTGTLVVSGTISASHYHIESVAIIDSTGSTTFGNSDDDVHTRTGSLAIWPLDASKGPTLTASVNSQQVFVKGFGGNYTAVTATHHTTSTSTYVVGLGNVNNVEVRIHSASVCSPGAIIVIKDEVPVRSGTNITLTASHLETIDNAGTYVITGTMPAVSLYSNGSNWFVF
jgi:hypothetical protein